MIKSCVLNRFIVLNRLLASFPTNVFRVSSETISCNNAAYESALVDHRTVYTLVSLID